MFLKEFTNSHQSCIYLPKNIKTLIIVMTQIN